MSYPLNVFLVNTFAADATLVSLLANRGDGQPAIYPLHRRDLVDPVYPILTIARIGTGMNSRMFSDTELATLMDEPKFCIDAWAQINVDQCIAIMTRVRQILKAPSFAIGNQYFSGYKIRETAYRDDLFDEPNATFHVHAEFVTWVSEKFGNPQPIPAP